jgi:hypothetical protein
MPYLLSRDIHLKKLLLRLKMSNKRRKKKRRMKMNNY